MPNCLSCKGVVEGIIARLGELFFQKNFLGVIKMLIDNEDKTLIEKKISSEPVFDGVLLHVRKWSQGNSRMD